MAEEKYVIKQRVGEISQNPKGWTKEVNLVSWFGADPKYDIRDWAPAHTRAGKGVTLTEGEMWKLYKILEQHFET